MIKTYRILTIIFALTAFAGWLYFIPQIEPSIFKYITSFVIGWTCGSAFARSILDFPKSN